jgi:transcription initiation factor TFIIH subunit 4
MRGYAMIPRRRFFLYSFGDALLMHTVCSQREEAKLVLERLHIIAHVQEPREPRAYRLHASFANSLRQALTGSGTSASFGEACTDGAPRVSIEALDAWARGQWQALLYYMVGAAGSGATQHPTNIPAATSSMMTLLDSGNFVSSKAGRTHITKDGFAFLLEETHAQVWSLLIVYLNKGEEVSYAGLILSVTSHADCSIDSSIWIKMTCWHSSSCLVP